MSSNNSNGKPSLKSAIDLKSLALKALGFLYAQFIKLWTPAQVLLAVFGLALALFFGNELRVSLLNTQDSITKVLEAKIEPARSSAQGNTVLLLSNLKYYDWTNSEHLNTRKLDSILEEMNGKIQQSTRNGAAMNASKVIDDHKLKVITRGSAAPWQTAITGERKDWFTTVSALSLRGNSLNEVPFGPDNKARLEEVLKHNPEILADLHIASELGPLMKNMDSASGELLKIVQVYFITQSGVFILCAPSVKDHSRYYGNEFKPYAKHEDRSYFWEAVDPKSTTPKTAPFDYVSKPYIDLGGNGIVVTFSKKFDLPDRRVGVFCVDAQLPDYVTNEIKNYLKSLGATVSDFHWSNANGIEPAVGEPFPKEFSWFEKEVKKSEEAQSIVLGTITTEPGKTTSGQSLDEAGNVVRFTVPVESVELENGNKRTRLLCVEFNFDSIREKMTRNLLFFTAGIVLVVAVTWSLLRDYTVLKREMSNVLEKMSNVMRDASTPFAWLNEKNEFNKVNNSILSVLGYENIEALKRDSPTFRGFITASTQPIYDEVLSKSRDGQETGEYEIDMLTKTGKVLHVRAHGERIPYPTLWRRGLPHRFGILVEVTEAKAIAEPELAIDKRQAPRRLSVRG
jgi:hypothetical protein